MSFPLVVIFITGTLSFVSCAPSPAKSLVSPECRNVPRDEETGIREFASFVDLREEFHRAEAESQLDYSHARRAMMAEYFFYQWKKCYKESVSELQWQRTAARIRSLHDELPPDLENLLK